MPDINPTRRLRLVVAFDGAGYHGWQAGRSGRGVADVVQSVMADSLGVVDDLVSSSRTDSGVHAFGLVAHVDVPRIAGRKSPDAVRSLLNAKLPSDIRVREASWVAPTFHARFDARSKQYRYLIWNDAVMNPLMLGRAWHVPGPLDTGAMRRAAGQLVGQHDFRSFTSRRAGMLGSSVRCMDRLSIARKGCELAITLEADGFLYKMCRGIVGTLVHVGQGRMAAEAMAHWIDEPGIRAPGANAPAHGLVLWRVRYPR